MAGTPFWLNPLTGLPDTTSYLNFIRDPNQPFPSFDLTLYVYNYASFTNSGAGVSWIPFDSLWGYTTDYHRIVTEVDPATGLPRIIVGNDQGVFSVLDDNGTMETSLGGTAIAAGDRNGNLQVTQFYYGAVQPSSAAAQIAGALFYGSAQDDGGPVSDPSILTNGDTQWYGPGGDATGVGTDQQGGGTAYQYFWPCCGGAYTNVFQFLPEGLSGTGDYIGRTFGLFQTANGLPTPDCAVAVHRWRQLRRQPGQ